MSIYVENEATKNFLNFRLTIILSQIAKVGQCLTLMNIVSLSD